MKFFKEINSRLTVRDRALAQVDQGMVCACNLESDQAINLYTDVVVELGGEA